MQNYKYVVAFVFASLACILSGCQKESVFLTRPKPEVIIKANDPRLKQAVIHFSEDTVYVLKTDLIRNAAQLLKIDAGTLVKVAENIAIIINDGAEIDAVGTATEPIVFTLATDKGKAGIITTEFKFWKGIGIYSSANSKSSGTMSFVRIEFAGQAVENNLTASLYLENVNSKTILNNIQISYSDQPSFEFNGGDVNASYLVTYASNNYDFKIQNGYKGKIQHLLAYRHPYFFPGFVKAGLLIKGATTFPILSNSSIIGPGLKSTDVNAIQQTALLLTEGARCHIANSVFLAYPYQGLYIDNRETATSFLKNESTITTSIFQSNTPSSTFTLPSGILPPYTSIDLKNFLLQTALDNRQYTSASEFLLKDPLNYNNNPDPTPDANSPLLNGAKFDSAPFSDAFFKKVTYRGAFGTENWMQGWVNFTPLQTNYNY